MSEGWVAAHMFCPACGAERLRVLSNNSPVGDFACDACAEEFELKAKRGAGAVDPGRAFGAMTARLAALYRDNNNVRPKIRQQLQVLRDRGWLEFNGRGVYRRTA